MQLNAATDFENVKAGLSKRNKKEARDKLQILMDQINSAMVALQWDLARLQFHSVQSTTEAAMDPSVSLCLILNLSYSLLDPPVPICATQNQAAIWIHPVQPFQFMSPPRVVMDSFTALPKGLSTTPRLLGSENLFPFELDKNMQSILRVKDVC